MGGDSADEVTYNASPYAVNGVPAFGASGETGEPDLTGVEVEQSDSEIVISNSYFRVAIDTNGLITSIVDAATQREVIPSGTRGNLLQLFRDTPTQWDAWDIDKEYKRVGQDLVDADAVELNAESDQSASVRIVRSFGASKVEQTLTVSAESRAIEIVTEIDWHERKKLLKLGFPIDVHSTHAASEIQFGHIDRPTHTNTSWDTARFETVAHRWVHVADASFGVGVANDSTYGHDITRTATETGRTFTTVRQSLLRAPLFPDPEADQGAHTLRSSLVVGTVATAIEEGYRLNIPLRRAGGTSTTPLVASDNPAVVIETVKLARDRSGDVVVRLYEAHGTRASATISTSFENAGVVISDVLERPLDGVQVDTDAGAGARLELNPFQLVTLRFSRK